MFVILERSAELITGEKNSMESLLKFFKAFPACAEEVLYQQAGLWGMSRVAVTLLRDKYRYWKAESLREKQRQVGLKTKNLRRSKKSS